MEEKEKDITRSNSNRRVLITGASGGIGAQIGNLLSEQGYSVVLCYNKNKSKVLTLKERIEEKHPESRVDILGFDVSCRSEVKEVLEADMEKFGVYYGVVLAGGINKDNPFPILKDEEWDRVISTNLDGLYNVLKPVVMPMVSSRIRGRIIAISSISGIIGNRGQVNYSASKAGIIGACKALALELAKHKITVNVVAPGIIDTEMIKGLDPEEIKKIIPMRRIGTPREVASCVGYLMSEDASYITRQVISVNGGMF